MKIWDRFCFRTSEGALIHGIDKMFKIIWRCSRDFFWKHIFRFVRLSVCVVFAVLLWLSGPGRLSLLSAPKTRPSARRWLQLHGQTRLQIVWFFSTKLIECIQKLPHQYYFDEISFSSVVLSLRFPFLPRCHSVGRPRVLWSLPHCVGVSQPWVFAKQVFWTIFSPKAVLSPFRMKLSTSVLGGLFGRLLAFFPVRRTPACPGKSQSRSQPARRDR